MTINIDAELRSIYCAAGDRLGSRIDAEIGDCEGRSETDACDFLRERGIQVTPYLLRRWRQIRHPAGPRYFKIGKRVYYRESDLVAWGYTLFSLRYRSRWPDQGPTDQAA